MRAGATLDSEVSDMFKGGKFMNFRYKRTLKLISIFTLVVLLTVGIGSVSAANLEENTVDFDRENLTAGVQYEELKLDLDEEDIDEANIVLSLGETEYYNSTVKFDENQEYGLTLDQEDGFVFNKTGELNATVSWGENETTGKIMVLPPEINFTINDFSMDFIATSGIDREYQVNITSVDTAGDPIENGTLWLIPADQNLNKTYINNNSDSKELILDENGTGTFNFTPQSPIEINWKVGCEDTDKEDAVFVQEPTLKASTPYMEIYSPTLNRTLDTGEEKLSMSLPFGDTHELMITLKTADTRDRPLENGSEVSIDGSFKEYKVSSTTEYKEGYSGQLGWISLTPTATGPEVIEILVDGSTSAYIDVYKGDYKELVIDGPENFAVGEEATYTVKLDNGEPVEDAVVKIDGEKKITDQDGKVVYKHNSTGTVDVWAEKEGDDVKYYSAWMETNIEYTLVEKELELTVKTDEGHHITDREIEFKITHDGEPVENAVITTGHKEKETGQDGTVKIVFSEPGQHEVNADAPGYQTEEEVIKYNTDEVTVNIGETPGTTVISVIIVILGSALLLKKRGI